MQPNAASMEDQKSRNPIKIYKQINSKDSNYRNAEEEACARELLELGQESGSPFSIVMQDNSSNKNNNTNGTNIKRVVMKVPHSSVSKAKQNNILINFPNLDGTVDDEDGDESSTNHDVSKCIEAKASKSPTTSISGVSHTPLNSSPSSAQYTNSESSLKIISRNTSVNCADVVSVPSITNQNEYHKCEYQKSDNDTNSIVKIESRVISLNHSPEKTTSTSNSESNFSRQLNSNHSGRVISSISEMNENRSNSALVNRMSNDTDMNEEKNKNFGASGSTLSEAINNSNKISPTFSSSIPYKPKTKALSSFSIESLVSKESSGVRYSSKQLVNPVVLENSNDLSPVNLSTKPFAQPENNFVNNLIPKISPIAHQTPCEANDSQTTVKVPTAHNLPLENQVAKPDSSASETADDASRSIFGNKNASKLSSSTFSLVPNFNFLANKTSKSESPKKQDSETENSPSVISLNDKGIKQHCSDSSPVHKKDDGNITASKIHDRINSEHSCSESSDKLVDTLSDDKDITSQPSKTATENASESLHPSAEDLSSLVKSKESENELPNSDVDIKSSEVNQLHLDVKENTQSPISICSPSDIAASSQKTLLSSTKEKNREEETKTNCDLNQDDAESSETFHESNTIGEEGRVSPGPQAQRSSEKERLQTSLSEEDTITNLNQRKIEENTPSSSYKSELQTTEISNPEGNDVELSAARDIDTTKEEVCDQSESRKEEVQTITDQHTSHISNLMEQTNVETKPLENVSTNKNHKETLFVKEIDVVRVDDSVKEEIEHIRKDEPKSEEVEEQNSDKNFDDSIHVEKEPTVALESENKVVPAKTTQVSNLACDNDEDKSSIKVPEPSESEFSNSPIPASLKNSSIEQKLISNLDDSESKEELIEHNVQNPLATFESSGHQKELHESDISQTRSQDETLTSEDVLTSQTNSLENDSNKGIASAHLDKSDSKDTSKSPDAYQLVISLPSPTEEEKDLNAESDSEAELVNETTIPRKDDPSSKSEGHPEDQEKEKDVLHESALVKNDIINCEKENLGGDETVTMPPSISRSFNPSEAISLEINDQSIVELSKGDFSSKEHLSEGALDVEISETKGEKSPCTTTCDITTSSTTIITTSSLSSDQTNVPLTSSIGRDSETLDMQPTNSNEQEIGNRKESESLSENSTSLSLLDPEDSVDEKQASSAPTNNETILERNTDISSIVKDGSKSDAADHDVRNSSSTVEISSKDISNKSEIEHIIRSNDKIDNTPRSSKSPCSLLDSNENNNSVSLHSSVHATSENSSSPSESFSTSSSSSLPTKSILPIISPSINNMNDTAIDKVEQESTTDFVDTNSIIENVPTQSIQESPKVSKVI